MSLKCGIVGLPNVGKSTLFNCISSGKAQAANFPFCTIEPNIGSTTVPDPRLQVLESLVHPKRVVPATVAATSSWPISARPTPSCTCSAASTTPTSPMWTAA